MISMNRLFNTQKIFDFFLQRLASLSKRKRLRPLVPIIAGGFAKLNLVINRPAKCKTPKELAETWKKLMPSDNQGDYIITTYNDRIAHAEIHIHCPLRGSKDKNACDKFMHYDRTLMKRVRGQLEVIESQSDPGKNFCVLAISMQNIPC
jgi:hypothetical protein